MCIGEKRMFQIASEAVKVSKDGYRISEYMRQGNHYVPQKKIIKTSQIPHHSDLW